MSGKLGRLAPYPESDRPRLKLAKYLLPQALPAVPTAVDWYSKVQAWSMAGNDKVGDCTVAAIAHMIESVTAYTTGQPVEITDADVLAAYSAVSGYVPGRPSTDVGARIQDVLDYARKTGIGGYKIIAFAEADVTNPDEIARAEDLFCGLDIGINLPQSAIDQFDAGGDVTWTVVKKSPIAGGHSTYEPGLYPGGDQPTITWAQRIRMAQAFWQAYVEEGWVIFMEGWTYPGIDLQTLGADFAVLTGEPNPFPSPEPAPPTPVPSPPAPTGTGCLSVTAGLLLLLAGIARR